MIAEHSLAVFGWILCGPNIFLLSTVVTESQLDGILTKIWDMEDVPVKPGKEYSSVCEDNKPPQRIKKGGMLFHCPLNKLTTYTWDIEGPSQVT